MVEFLKKSATFSPVRGIGQVKAAGAPATDATILSLRPGKAVEISRHLQLVMEVNLRRRVHLHIMYSGGIAKSFTESENILKETGFRGEYMAGRMAFDS